MTAQRIRIATRSTVLFIVLCACTGQDADESADTAAPSPAVIISTPSENATVEGTVQIVLETRNVMIRPAGTNEPGTGHHHLFIDRDLTPVGEPIPTEQGIVHLGMAQMEYAIENLPPGEHIVIAVVGDYQHVRLGNVATDTLRFTVSGT